MTIKEITYGGLSIALLSICSWISIPLAVPFTMQSFAVFFPMFFCGVPKEVSFTSLLTFCVVY